MTTRSLADALSVASTTAHGVVQLATSGESAATKATAANDARLSDPRTPTSHTHPPSEIAGLAEAVQDFVGAMVVAGSGVTATYDDTAGTLTIAVTGADTAAIQEIARDTIGAALVAGSGIGIVVDDAGDTITISNTASLDTAAVQEIARDAVGTALVAGTNMTVTVDDAANTITLDAGTTAASVVGLDERIQDTVAAALTNGGNVGIAYDDTAGTITLTVTGVPAHSHATSDITGLAEYIRDTAGTAIVAGANVTVTVDDAGDTITIAGDTAAINELARDAVGAALVGGVGITVTVSDAGDTITIDATGGVAPGVHASTHASGGSDPVALAASQITSGTLAIARLASGTPDGTKFVRDDGTLAVPTGADSAAATHAATSKATPVDADELPLADSAASYALKKLTWANLKATAKSYFDTLYAAITHTHAASDIASGTVATARLGSGSADGTTYLRGDQTWAALSGTVAADITGKSAKTDALNSATTTVNVSSATAPTSGQVLTATGSTAATWQTPSGGASGYLPYALSLGLFAGATLSSGAAILAANGGTALVAVALAAPLLLESVTIRENSTTLARGWEWRLYKDTGSATLAEVAGANGSETWTATIASNRTAAATTPTTVAAGAYWLAVRATDASNGLNLSGLSVGAGAGGLGGDGIQTKTVGALGSTLDATAATWAKSSNIVAARLNGAVFGTTTAF